MRGRRPSGALKGRSHGRGRRPIRLSWLAVPTLLLTVSALTPLAYATLPDPSWIHGLYDDADLDDVVTTVTSATGAVGSPPGYDPSLDVAVQESAASSDQSPALALPLPSDQIRAPPAS